jgi:hypothetical protein
MQEFQVLPIDRALGEWIRTNMRDPIYGLPVHAEPATGYGPCRLCLRTFVPGESRILFLYNPFSPEQEADFAGPIFIHEKPCATYEPWSGFPADVTGLPIIFLGYDRDKHRVGWRSPTNASIETALDELWDMGAEVIHVRNAEAKCFIARIELAPSEVLRTA